MSREKPLLTSGHSRIRPYSQTTTLLKGVKLSPFQTARAVFLSEKTDSFEHEEGPEECKPYGEVEFAQGIAAQCDSGLYGPARSCAGIVCYCDLHHSNCEAVLRRMMRCRNSGPLQTPLAVGTSLARYLEGSLNGLGGSAQGVEGVVQRVGRIRSRG